MTWRATSAEPYLGKESVGALCRPLRGVAVAPVRPFAVAAWFGAEVRSQAVAPDALHGSFLVKLLALVPE
jgi:hypothetical protein